MTNLSLSILGLFYSLGGDWGEGFLVIVLLVLLLSFLLLFFITCCPFSFDKSLIIISNYPSLVSFVLLGVLGDGVLVVILFRWFVCFLFGWFGFCCCFICLFVVILFLSGYRCFCLLLLLGVVAPPPPTTTTTNYRCCVVVIVNKS